MTANSEPFRDQRAARDRLSTRIAETLQEDTRVAAVWLHGSMGRGQFDDLSDLDVWVVVEDEHWESWLAGRERFMARLGEPLLLYDVPANAPGAGAFTTVLFQGPAGPLNVDWSWQPQSQARVPEDARLLFDRVGLPARVEPQAATSRERAVDLTRRERFFWAMLPIVAKMIYRGQAWDALRMIVMLRDGLRQIEALAGVSSQPERDGPLTSRLAQLDYLQSMAGQAKGLEPKIAEIGGVIPSEAVTAVCTFLETVKAGIQQQPSRVD